MTDKTAAHKTKTGSAKARRTAARLAAVQVLYQVRLNRQDAFAALQDFVDHRIGVRLDDETPVTPDRDLLSHIVQSATARAADLDALVGRALGARGEIEALLDCILRAGAAELLADAATATGVIINDYLTVTAAFYDGNETKIVNAVLDNIAKAVRD